MQCGGGRAAAQVGQSVQSVQRKREQAGVVLGGGRRGYFSLA
jgi:hypothetical protein